MGRVKVKAGSAERYWDPKRQGLNLGFFEGFRKGRRVRLNQGFKGMGLNPQVGSKDYSKRPPLILETNSFNQAKTNIILADENNLNNLMIHSTKTKYVVCN